MIVAPLNETTPLRMIATDGDTSLFGRIKVFNSAGTLVFTLSMAHISEGLYSVDFTPSVSGFHSAVGQFFTDAGFTTDAGFELTLEDIDVSTLKASVARLLGLSQENIVVDSQFYNIDGCLTSYRIRTYDSKANATAAGATGLVASYTATLLYTGGQISSITVVRDV